MRKRLVVWATSRTAKEGVFQGGFQGSCGDPCRHVCQALNAFICVSPCGSILGPFWVHSGSILRVHFGSSLGPVCLLSEW